VSVPVDLEREGLQSKLEANRKKLERQVGRARMLGAVPIHAGPESSGTNYAYSAAMNTISSPVTNAPQVNLRSSAQT
jgi:hypothetical protein